MTWQLNLRRSSSCSTTRPVHRPGSQTCERPRMQHFLSIDDSRRAFNTLRKLLLRDVSRWTRRRFSVGFTIWVAGTFIRSATRTTSTSLPLASTVYRGPGARLFVSPHPLFDPPGKTMMPFVDADTSLRVDLLRADRGIMSRAIPLDLPSGPLRVS